MLKIGKKITDSNVSEASADSMVAGWESHFSTFMVSNERLSQLFELEGIPTLGDFLEIFDSPVDVILNGDKIWPPERAQVY